MTTYGKKIILDPNTGQVTEVDYTAEEIAARDLSELDFLATLAEEDDRNSRLKKAADFITSQNYAGAYSLVANWDSLTGAQRANVMQSVVKSIACIALIVDRLRDIDPDAL